jgi:uncharacterized iron-regulated membrane protein
VYAVIIGLTGSALIFKDEIQRTQQPNIYHVAPVAQKTTLDATVRKIESSHPEWKAFALRNFDSAQAVDVLMRPATGESTPNYRVVSINPYTGEVLLDRLRYAGFLNFMSNLHVYLLSGETGLLVSGWLAFGLLLLTLSGLILWWPGVQRWAAALVLTSRSSWRRLNWDLHTVVGFWSSALFIVVIVTGLDFAFPGATGKMIEFSTGRGFHDTGVSLEENSRKAIVSSAPVITIDNALAAARHALPQEAPPGYLQLPSTPRLPYRATGYYNGAAPYSQVVRILLDSHSGALLASSDTRNQDIGSRIEQYFVAVHFGLFGGPGILGLAVKIIWVLLGLVPALLAGTGALMYWNRKLRPIWRNMTQHEANRTEGI